MEMMKPNIFRFLVSSPSRFVGEYKSDTITIEHSWIGMNDVELGLQPGPYSRNYFVFSIEIEQPEQKSIIIPQYSHVAELACSLMSVLYGKRFDSHGTLVSHGRFYTPNFHPFEASGLYNSAPYNHVPRVDLEIPLNLTEFGRIASLLIDESIDSGLVNVFFAAAGFYCRALQTFESNPSSAYLDLITCGEIMSNFYDYNPADVLDSEAASWLAQIREGMPTGEALARSIGGRLLSIKRRFALTLLRLLTIHFFDKTESTYPHSALLATDIEKRIKSSYDLRSLYVHTGEDFGKYIRLHPNFGNETSIAYTKDLNERLSKALTFAPTFVGMERIIRYCLLRLLHLNGLAIDPALAGEGLSQHLSS